MSGDGQQVFPHGRTNAASGTIQPEGGSRQAFCDVLELANARGTSIGGITTWVIGVGIGEEGV